MKTGQITYYIEIPIEVSYSCHKAERQTMEYPGCEAGITVDFIGYPDDAKLNEIVDKNASEIKEACLEDAEI